MLQICAGTNAAAVSFPLPPAILPPSPFPIRRYKDGLKNLTLHGPHRAPVMPVRLLLGA